MIQRNLHNRSPVIIQHHLDILETPSRLHHQLIKFGSQYSEWADIRHLGVMGKDDSGLNWRRQCESD